MPAKKITYESDRNFYLIGIAASIKNYTLCFLLNDLLQVQFTRQVDLELFQKERSLKQAFAVFLGHHELASTDFWLFNNKSGSEALLPEAAMFDYLLKVTGAGREWRHLPTELKQLEGVLTAAEIPVKSIKNPDRLVYELPASPQVKPWRKKFVK